MGEFEDLCEEGEVLWGRRGGEGGEGEREDGGDFGELCGGGGGVGEEVVVELVEECRVVWGFHVGCVLVHGL